MKQYISDIITDYLSWRPGCAYFISAQTGTGKSTFVFEKLLKNAVRQDKYVIYLCNRKSLQNQMKNSLDPSRTLNVGYDISEEEQNHILFLTYQYCETTGQFPDFKVMEVPTRMSRSEKFKYNMSPEKYTLCIPRDQVLYYIFDEAHYIVSDSTFNSGTNYWDWSKMICSNSISVFITATPGPIFGYYMNYIMHSIHTTSSKLSLDGPEISTSCLHSEPNYYMEEVLKEANEIDVLRRNKRSELNLPINLETLQFIECLLNFTGLIKSKNIELTFRKQEDINRQVNLYGYPFWLGLVFVKYSKQYFIENEGIYPLGSKIYKFKNDYSYLNPIYFEDFSDLIEDIIASDKQWIVFVEKTKVGQNLADKLNEKKCKAVFVSSATRKQIKGGTKDTLLEIAECENFSCKVLITTSVLDCGINLKNPNLTNIVIEQSEKTEFLQMIGRVRALENQKVDLYIKAFSLQRIQQLINQLENKLRFMSQMLEKEIVIEEIYADKRKFVFPLLYENFSNNRKKYQLSHTAYVYCLYSLYDYIEAKCDAPYPINLDFYIRQQLKWLGKKYDITCWYKYQEKTNKIIDLLKKTMSQGLLEIEAQNELCKKCIDAIIELPEVLLSPNMIRFKKEYIRRCNSTYYAKKKLSNQRTGKTNIRKTSLEERILPKKEFLNRCFEHLKLPYRIESRQKTKNGKRMTCWGINYKECSQAST